MERTSRCVFGMSVVTTVAELSAKLHEVRSLICCDCPWYTSSILLCRDADAFEDLPRFQGLWWRAARCRVLAFGRVCVSSSGP